VRAHVAAASGTGNLLYGGGPVQSAPKVFLILWGSQWSSDPSGEASILQSFYGGVGGSSWLSAVDQYCSPSTAPCSQSTNVSFGGVWPDNSSTAPHRPSQSQLAAEAAKGSAHFSDHSVNAQFVVATSHNNNSSGFGSRYCAYHSTTSASGATISWTNLPYITDAGASCGANFNGLGAKAGITIVSGHESAESITDPLPSSGWVDSSGEENGDKCAWITSGNQGASANTTLTTGTFPVQSTWSNTSANCPTVS
jgi:serine protease